MEKYLDRIEEVAKEARKAHILANSKIVETRSRINAQLEGLQSGNNFITKMEKNIQDLIIATDIDIEKIRDEYLQELEKFYELDGARVTDDIKLLGGNFILSHDKLSQLSNKYRKNATMHAAVEKYGADNNLGVKSLQPQQTRIDLINSFISLIEPVYKNAPSSLYADDETVFNLFNHRKQQILEKLWD